MLSLHMLYHLPEPATGIDEAARIVSERGCVVVATNGSDHLAELNQLWLPLLDRARIISDVEDAGLVNPRLNGDAAGVLLRGRFIDVAERRLRSTVILTDPRPALAHAASTTAGRLVPPEVLDHLRADIEAIIARDGAFRITTDVALFHARQQR